ncbi:hypothetical protein ES703_70387 [subsurface metagenome]
MKIHIHHPALLKIVEETPDGDRVILDNLSSLDEGIIESDVIFPIDHATVLKVTTLPNITYRFIITPKVLMIQYLNDLKDVNVPSPTDQYLIYWDQAAAKWQCKALSAADIPDLPTSKITSGRFPLSRIPTGPDTLILTAKGAGIDPAYQAPLPVYDYPMKLKPPFARYVMPGWHAYQEMAALVAVGRIYFTPIFVTETTTYDRIAVNVDVALAGTADLRIFAWANGLPGALILSAGTVDTGTIGFKEITISHELTRGYYFLAVRCTAACELRGLYPFSLVTSPVPALRISQYINPSFIVLTANAAYSDPAPEITGIATVGCAFLILRES